MRETEESPVIPLEKGAASEAEPGNGKPDRGQLVAGMDVARRLESSADLATRARRHAKRGKKGDARRRARRQLKKLIATLRHAQEAVLSAGVDADARAGHERVLDTLDGQLKAFVDGKPKKKRMKQVALAAKLARKSL